MRKKLFKKMLSVLMCIAMITSLLPANFVSAQEGPNLILNPGFEMEVSGGEIIPEWSMMSSSFNPDGTLKTGLDIQVTGLQKNTGSKSLYISDSMAGVAATVYSSAMEVVTGQNVVFRYMAYDKKSTISGEIRFYKSAADVAIGGQLLRQSAAITTTTDATNTKVWTENTIEATVPAEATVARVVFYTSSASSGSTFIDDLYFGVKDIVVLPTPTPTPTVTPSPTPTPTQTPTPTPAPVSPNLATNPGFETLPTESETVPGWAITNNSAPDGISVQINNQQKSSGSKSLYISDASTSVSTIVYSAAIAVTPGQDTVLRFKAFDKKDSITAAIRFYKSDSDNLTKGYITPSFSSAISTTSGVWTDNIIEAKVPAEATVAKILFYTVSSSLGSAYIDDVYFGVKETIPGEKIDYTLENLGTLVHSVNISRSVFGKDASGRLLGYSLVNGTPCSLVVTDVATDTVLAQLPIQDTANNVTYTTTPTNRGLAIMPDGAVYICGTPSYMFKYVPGSSKVEFVSETMASQAFNMKNGPDGILIISAYKDSVAFEFDTKTNEVKSLGSIMPNEDYAYSVAYDEVNNDYYFGIGSHAHLIKYDRDTGEKTEITLPEPYATVGNFVWDLKVVEGKLFMRFSPGGTIAYDIPTQTFDEVGNENVTSRFFTDKSPVDSKVYYTTNGFIGYYNLDDKSYTLTDKVVEGYSTGLYFAELDAPEFPGYTLVGITRYGRLFKYNLETGNHKQSLLNINGEATTLQNPSTSNDGRIHVSAYLTGGNAIYDPITGMMQEFSNQTLGLGQSLPQSDTHIHYKDKTLYTTYPNAYVHLYDPKKPWDYSNGIGTNPGKLFTPYEQGEQDRIFAGYVIEEKDKVVVGSVPKYGLLGGALTVYDFKTGEKEIFYNIIPNQSITALTYKDGLIYGGSNIWGGMGQDPSETDAKLFIWDMEKKEIVFEKIPVPGARGITTMIVGPDGKIWGNAEGDLFIFNPETRLVEHTQTIKDVSYANSQVWRDAMYGIGTDGNVYGVISSMFFKIDAETKEITVIRDEGKRVRFTQDDFGNFYLIEELNLLKLTIPELLVKPIGATMSISSTTIKTNETADISVTGLLEKGRGIEYLEGRGTQYFSSNNEIVSIENNSIKGLKAGSAEVWTVTNIQGSQFETNKITVTVEQAPIDNTDGDSDSENPVTPPVVPPVTSIDIPDDKNEAADYVAEAMQKAGAVSIDPSAVVVNGTSIAVELDSDSLAKAIENLGKVETELAKAINEAGMNIKLEKVLTINVPEVDNASGVGVKIPVSAFDLAKDNKVSSIDLDTGVAKIALQPDMLKNKIGTDAKIVEITSAVINKTELSKEVVQKVGDNPVYDFNVFVDGEKVSKFNGNKSVEVTLDYQLKPGEDPNKVVVYYINDKDELEVVRNSKYNAQTGKVTFTTNHFSQYVAKQPDVSFKDVGSGNWSKSYVEALAARGIINGTGEGLFEPERSITRAEFTKIIMYAFDLVDETAETSFSDVNGEDWYYKAVASAQKLNIVSGIGNNMFGADELISRQDMATIAYNAAKVAGIVINNIGSAKQLTDESSIAGYAIDSVKVMQNTGIISGRDNGKFSPEEKASRAEASKIIYLLFKGL